MKAWIITAAIITATAATGADIPVDLGTVTIPDAAVADVQAYLETQQLTTTTTTQEQRIDPEDGHTYTVTVTTVTVVPETPKAKLARLMRAAAIRELRQAIKAMRQEREDAKAAAAVESAPDPVAKVAE